MVVLGEESRVVRVERMLLKIGSVWGGKTPAVMVWPWIWYSWEMDLHWFISCKVF